MTDTVNVPREKLEEVRGVLAERIQGSPARSPAHNARVLIDTMLEAAPKAEPVSDPYKLDRAEIIEAVKVAMNDAWCDITSDTGCWPADLHRASERGPVRIEYRPAIWTETTAEMVANILAQPEAPKVEQEPVALDWQSIAMWMGFAASVIKSGELWTSQCQSAFDEALAAYGRLSSTHPAPASDELSAAIRDIAAERQRQVEGEGYSHSRDDGYELGELGLAAALYALPYEAELAGEKLISQDDHIGLDMALELSCGWNLKPDSDRRRRLVKAAALIAAEIERLDRLAKHKGPQ